MLETSTAWNTEEPLYSRLPGDRAERYYGNPVCKWIVEPFDRFLLASKKIVTDLLEVDLNPATCNSRFLDFLGMLAGFYGGDYWDPRWSDDSKRSLIRDSYLRIWAEKGGLKCLSLVLTDLHVTNQVVPTNDFLVGTSVVGDRIGFLPWDYTIYLPFEYRGTDKELLAARINVLFGSCWCESRITFRGNFTEIDLRNS